MNKKIQKTISENKILIVDIEIAGTGLNLKGNEKINFEEDLIVEVGVTAVNLSTGEKKLIFDQVCNNGITEAHRNSWIFEKTSLTFEEVLDAQPLDIPKLQALFDWYALTAFTQAFDFDFLSRDGLKFSYLPCLMKLSTPVCKIPPTPAMQKWYPHLEFKNPNAQEAYRMFYPDREFTEIHRGGDDSFHEADIAKYLFDVGVLVLDEVKES